MNEKVGAYLRRRAGWYLLIFGAAVLFWNVLYSALSQPKDNEQLHLSLFGAGPAPDSFCAELEAALPQVTAQKLGAVTADRCDGENTYIQVLATARAQTSDLILVAESLLTPDATGESPVPAGNFPGFSQEEWERVMGPLPEGMTLYQVEGECLGIVHGGRPDGRQSRFEAMYGVQGTWILFFGENSANLGGLLGQGREEDRAALELAVYLWEAMP